MSASTLKENSLVAREEPFVVGEKFFAKGGVAPWTRIGENSEWYEGRIFQVKKKSL